MSSADEWPHDILRGEHSADCRRCTIEKLAADNKALRDFVDERNAFIGNVCRETEITDPSKLLDRVRWLIERHLRLAGLEK